MPREAKGQVIDKVVKGRDGRGDISYSIRFRVPEVLPGGLKRKRRVLEQVGYASEGWTKEKAQQRLDDTMAAVRIGMWRPAEVPDPVEVGEDPLFHEFASDWWENKKHDLSEKTRDSYEDQLVNDILPFFRNHRLSQITVAEVDRFRDALKMRGKVPPLRADGTGGRATPQSERQHLSATTVNKRLTRLGQILELALERDLIARNPVKVGKRKLAEKAQPPVFLESPLHIATVLEAAAMVDALQPSTNQTVGRAAGVATLVLAGLRAGEFGETTWFEIDLDRGRIDVGRAKTPNSYRSVHIVPLLHGYLSQWKEESPATDPTDLAFPNTAGNKRNKENIGKSLLKPVLTLADKLLAERGQQLLPRGVTPHKLRHTFASVLFAIGRDPVFVMRQLGHSRATFTMEVYAHAMDLSELERAQLKALVEGQLVDWAPLGTEAPERGEEPPEAIGL